MEKTLKLSNGLKVIYRYNQKTPRVAINFFINTGIIDEKKAGEMSLVKKLLLQGTENLSAKELAEKIDLYAIDFVSDVKQDYLKLKVVVLNDETENAVDILSDVVLHSTFENFEKEINKLKGEIKSDLDEITTKALDNLVKNLYKNHPYGNVYSRIMENIDNITKDDVKNLYYSNLIAENCIISVVGDIDESKMQNLLEEYFASIPQATIKKTIPDIQHLTKAETVVIKQEKAEQAQVVKAWIVPAITSPDFPKLMVLNSILGSCGLSSRLFLELREKKGLAYDVRSSLEGLKLCSTFSLYIATAPQNIQVALDGFKEEVDKLKVELVSENELESAKNNILGKRAFLHETNSRQSFYLGYYEILGLGADFDKKIEEEIKKVTVEDIKDVATKYLNENFIVSLLAPEKFLPDCNA